MSEPEAVVPPAVEVHAGVAGASGGASGESSGTNPDEDRDGNDLDIQQPN